MLTKPIFIHICSEKISKKKSKKLKKKIRSVTDLQLDKIDLQKVASSPGRLMTGSESDLVQHAVKNEGMTLLHCTGGGMGVRILQGNKRGRGRLANVVVFEKHKKTREGCTVMQL